ncbi:MAG TPA: enoyl-CoA hydratase-related protein, partial [Paracoccaceae bacterium]|nr:enoyl-CoA hydratase-related protein [Paracoccaceae bacterium]
AEAHRLGLADEITNEGKALERALAVAGGLAGGPQAAIKAIKTQLSGLDELRAALRAEADQQRQRFPHGEHQEGAAAFREKRAPDFSGK